MQTLESRYLLIRSTLKTMLLGDLKKRTGLFIQISDGLGCSGLGKIAPLPGWSQETKEEALEQLRTVLQEKFICFENLFPSVSFGIQSALQPFELEKMKEKSLSPITPFRIGQLFQSSKSCLLECSKASLPFGSLNEIQKQLKLIENPTGKVKVAGLNFGETIAILKELKARQKNIPIHFNHNPEDFEHWEEPSKTLKEVIEFSRATNFPIALDESLQEYIPDQTMEIPSIKAWIYKPTLLGGQKEYFHREKNAKEKGVDLILSTCFETEVDLFHILKMSRANENKNQ